MKLSKSFIKNTIDIIENDESSDGRSFSVPLISAGKFSKRIWFGNLGYEPVNEVIPSLNILNEGKDSVPVRLLSFDYNNRETIFLGLWGEYKENSEKKVIEIPLNIESRLNISNVSTKYDRTTCWAWVVSYEISVVFCWVSDPIRPRPIQRIGGPRPLSI